MQTTRTLEIVSRLTNKLPFIYFLTLGIFFGQSLVSAAEQKNYGAHKSPRVEARLVSESTSLAPGKKNSIGLHLKLTTKWHTYWLNPGDSGMPLSVKWDLPSGWSPPQLVWPTPDRIETPPLATYGYSGELVLPFVLDVPASATGSVDLSGKFSFLVCDDVCVPENATLALKINLEPTQQASAWQKFFESSRARTPNALDPKLYRFERTPSEFMITVEGSAIPAAVDRLEFYPKAEGWLTTGAPRQFKRLPDGSWETRFSVGENAPAAPALPAGVLALYKRAKLEKAYEILGSSMPSVGAESSGNPVAEFSWTILVFAFLGGLILNLMPCVFPVLALKILGFVKHGAHSPQTSRKHAFSYSFGVIFTFLLLGGALALLRFGGQQLGWGFQLQSPYFLYALSTLLFLMSLNLFGVFEVSGSWMGMGDAWTRGDSLSTSFATGALAVVVATPCSAPFMGTAVGVALLQPWPVLLLIFFCLGLGMALPYYILATHPTYVRLLPKPGLWMVRLKELLAFPLLLTAIWLLWVLSLVTGADAAAGVLISLTGLYFAIWIGQRLSRPQTRQLILFIFASLSIALGVAGIRRGVETSSTQAVSASDDVWSKFSPEKVRAGLAEGRPVFIDFTAAWCITCKVNEKVALANSSVMEAFRAKNVLMLKADWTNSDPVITATLEKYGRAGVPLYLLFRPGTEAPEILPQILTPGIVLDALKKLP